MSHIARQPVTVLKPVTARIATCLARLHIDTIQDLWFHLPLHYEDRTQLTPIIDVLPGNAVLVEGTVVAVTPQFGRRPSLLCRIEDETGSLFLRFFYGQAYQKKRYQVGTRWRFFGEVRSYGSRLEIVHPEAEPVSEETTSLHLSDQLTPIYPTTKGISQRIWHTIMQAALDVLEKTEAHELELLPMVLPIQQKCSLKTALFYMHRPPVDAELSTMQAGKHPAHVRLAYEELMAHHVGLHQFRQQIHTKQAPVLVADALQEEKFLQQLPFALTGAQQRVLQDIDADLSRNQPMLRLIQGDVGSGKTIVACLAILRAVVNGYQAVLMAPTEILAEQHFALCQKWFTHVGFSVGFLVGSQTTAERLETLTDLQAGRMNILVGTHAVFQEDVNFSTLGLVVIDEQHRFGVHQRLALKNKGETAEIAPHQLIMTATPIPRTLAMTLYADLDVSIIDELPPGRQPIQTVLISSARRDEVVARVQALCAQGKQAYWVCTLIEESESLEAQAATTIQTTLAEMMPELRLGLIHGRLKSAEKEAVMRDFKEKRYDVLVATTVIEVGIDVQNAVVMVIENAERLGLSQLHQLRGRVGRGTDASFCVLLHDYALSKEARERLRVMHQYQDGFKIAEADLAIRGPGEVLGVRQAGLVKMKIADLLRDQYLLASVQKSSQFLVEHHPETVDALIARWLSGSEVYVGV
ncbi:MAG: ATP-dependent DNA helicase RecG [Gammaproteobacteria bacterium RIFCSPHIGHO2_12_FULL_45_9]|nr:MAG: ATP-dependent DNA helicase RecG [Gammaproteobacteria bacterium RIFCSPHIGHO2_12_FULL_45_9]